MAITNKKTGSILQIAGLDSSKPAEYISENSCVNTQNMEVIESLLCKRIGESILGAAISTANQIMAGCEFEREDVKYNIRIGLDKIEKYNTVSLEWDDITGTDLTGSETDIISTAVPLLSGQRILCITNGIDAIRKWDSSGNTQNLGGSPPRCKFLQEYKTYLVCANITGGTDIAERVQWCDTALPETWDSGNAGTVDLVEDGSGITGLNLFGNYLCVHKLNSIYLGYLVSSTSIFQFDRKNTGVGTIANNSIVNLPTGEQIFLAKDGIRIFNGITTNLIEAPVNDEIRRTINSTYSYNAYGVLVKEKDEVWIGIPIGDHQYGDYIYKFNYKTRVLYKDYRPSACMMWKGDSTSGLSWDEIDLAWDDYDYRWDDVAFSENSDQINVGYSNGVVTKINVSVLTDNNNAINAFWESKDFQDAQDVISRWKKIRFWAQGGTINVYYSVNGGENWTEIADSPFTLSESMPSDTSPLVGYFDSMGIRCRIKFVNNNAETFKLKQFILEYTPRESM